MNIQELDEKKKAELFIGDAVKSLRTQKGIPSKDLADALDLKAYQVSKIEKGTQLLSSEQLVKTLIYLEVSLDEFCLYLNATGEIVDRLEMKKALASFKHKRSQRQLKLLIKKSQNYYEKHKIAYFNHVYCMLKAFSVLEKTHYDYDTARTELTPIIDYLSAAGTWFEYEMTLFSNCFFMYPVNQSLKVANELMAKIQKNHTSKQYNELLQNLLINSAIYALEDKNHCKSAIELATQSLLTQMTMSLQNSISVKVIHQIAYYKLETDDYNEQQLIDLIKGLRLLGYQDYAQHHLALLTRHGIILKERL